MPNEFLTDWQILIGAVQHWLAGGNPYGAYPSFQGDMRLPGAFAYPPAALLLGWPAALLPWGISGVLMLLGSAIGFEYWARRSGSRTILPWLVIWLPLCQGVWIGQVTLLALVALALADQLADDKRDVPAGLLLALAIIKPQAVVLPAAYALLQALRGRRWRLLGAFGGLSALLWGGAALISGPHIYIQWIEGLRHYGPDLPNRPLLFLPFGPALGIMAGALWWRYGRSDWWCTLLLLSILLVPLSVVYAAVGLAFVVLRWRPQVPWYPLVLSWAMPVLLGGGPRTPDSIAAITQATVATMLVAGLAPVIPWGRLTRRWRSAAEPPSKR